MDFATLAMELTRRITLDVLPEEADVFDANAPDLKQSLQAEHDPASVFQSSAGFGESEFGPGDIMEALKTVGVLWATYKVIKEVGVEWKTGRVSFGDPVVQHIWAERMVGAGVPEPLAREIATKFESDLRRVMEQEK